MRGFYPLRYLTLARAQALGADGVDRPGGGQAVLNRDDDVQVIWVVQLSQFALDALELLHVGPRLAHEVGQRVRSRVDPAVVIGHRHAAHPRPCYLDPGRRIRVPRVPLPLSSLGRSMGLLEGTGSGSRPLPAAPPDVSPSVGTPLLDCGGAGTDRDWPTVRPAPLNPSLWPMSSLCQDIV